MIFVNRAALPVPEVLRSERARLATEKVRALLLSSDQDHLEQLRVTLDPVFWRGAKPALLQLFHGKCAYCESAIAATQPGDIEHFRPKEGAESLKGERDQTHYSWLAYDWDNILISCIDCGRRRKLGGRFAGKGALFPVEGHRAPLLASVSECRALEKGTLLDPCFDSPEEHLAFEEDGTCRSLTDRGQLTIDVLGMNRPSLLDQRRRA